MKSNQKGFTLIELVMVIVILAILGAVAIPQFANIQGEARIANEAGVAGAVRAGILTYFIDPNRGRRAFYPPSLDSITDFPTSCSVGANACFTVILQGGLTDQWQKIGFFLYRSPANNTNVWTYTPATGNFQKTTN